MKKKLIFSVFVAVAAISAGFYVQSKSFFQEDLLCANVEALAGDEMPPDEYCPGGKVLCATVIVQGETYKYYKK